jgi:rod shape-determining protein MreC
VRRLGAELSRHRDAERENVRLRELLGMRTELVPRSIAASVVSANLDDDTRMIVIDRGLEDGVRRDLAAVAWGGAVGRVVFADRRHAKIRLLTDPNSGVAALVQRSGVKGIVLGHGDREPELQYVPPYADVAHEDRVVTSGLDGIFPRGFGIGRVGSIEEQADGTRSIRLRPEIDYGALEHVLVVLEPPSGGLLDQPPAPPDR